MVALLSVLPLNASRAIGAFVGKLGYFPLGIRRRVVDQQLRAAFPELTDAERRRIAVGSYANLGRIAVEAALLSKVPREKLMSLFHPPVGWEHLERVRTWVAAAASRSVEKALAAGAEIERVPSPFKANGSRSGGTTTSARARSAKAQSRGGGAKGSRSSKKTSTASRQTARARKTAGRKKR